MRDLSFYSGSDEDSSLVRCDALLICINMPECRSRSLSSSSGYYGTYTQFYAVLFTELECS